jgi:hypothetical protein
LGELFKLAKLVNEPDEELKHVLAAELRRQGYGHAYDKRPTVNEPLANHTSEDKDSCDWNAFLGLKR